MLPSWCGLGAVLRLEFVWVCVSGATGDGVHPWQRAAFASPGFSGGKHNFAPVFATIPLPGNLGCACQRFVGGTHICFLFPSAEGRFGFPWHVPRLRFAWSRALISVAKKTLYFLHQRKPEGSDCCSRGVRLLPMLPMPAELVQKSVWSYPLAPGLVGFRAFLHLSEHVSGRNGKLLVYYSGGTPAPWLRSPVTDAF